MRILGIDPGLASTGVGVIEQRGGVWRVLAARDARTGSSAPLPQRLQKIHDLVAGCIRDFAPDAVAIESVFTAKNVRSAILMAHGRGAAILAASGARVPVFEYTPAEIKASVVGKGRATKAQVQQLIKVLLSLREPPANEHQADALACALTHAFRTRLVERIGGGESGIGSRESGVGGRESDGQNSEAKSLLALARRKRRRRR